MFTPNGALLELKKGGNPCNYCERVIIIIFVGMSLRGIQVIPYVKTLFFQ